MLISRMKLFEGGEYNNQPIGLGSFEITRKGRKGEGRFLIGVFLLSNSNEERKFLFSDSIKEKDVRQSQNSIKGPSSLKPPHPKLISSIVSKEEHRFFDFGDESSRNL